MTEKDKALLRIKWQADAVDTAAHGIIASINACQREGGYMNRAEVDSELSICLADIERIREPIRSVQCHIRIAISFQPKGNH